MIKQTIIVLSIDQAKDMLVECLATSLLDKTRLMNLLKEGKMDDLPNFATITDQEVVNLFIDHDLGRIVAIEESVDIIAIKADGFLEFVYEKV